MNYGPRIRRHLLACLVIVPVGLVLMTIARGCGWEMNNHGYEQVKNPE